MAASGMQFSWRWDGGTISPNLGGIWEMSVNIRIAQPSALVVQHTIFQQFNPPINYYENKTIKALMYHEFIYYTVMMFKNNQLYKV